MKKRTMIRLASWLVLSAFIAAGAWAQKNPKDKFDFPKLNPLKIPRVMQLTLKNGIKLFLIEDHRYPTVDMQGMLLTGSAFDPADKTGLASLTATVLRTGGTKSRTGDAIDRELETMATSIETDMTNEYATVSVSTLKENLDKAMPILAEIIRNPIFDKEKIDLAKIEARTAISRRNDDIGQITNREFDKLIYGSQSPYARQIEYASIDAITRDDIVAFYKKNFHPNNLWLAVWGDFNTDQMVKKIEGALGSWPASEIKPPAFPVFSYGFRPTVNHIEKTDVNQSNVMIGHIGGLTNDPDYPALAVMNRILSFDRMFKKVRTDEGLAYSVWGTYGAGFKVPGTFTAGVQTKSGSTMKAIQIMLGEIKRITSEEVSDEELNRAKEQYLNSYVFQFDSRAKIIRRMLTMAYYGYPLNFAEQLFKNIEKVTKADILRAAQKHIKPDQLQILVVGKQADFDKPLSELGKVNPIDITIPVPKGEKAPEATPESLAKGQEIFAKSIAAMGDPAKIKAIQSVLIKVDLTEITPMGEMKLDAVITTVYPDKMNMLINTPQGKVTLIINTDKGVMKMGPNTMPLPEGQLKPMLENMKHDPFYIWQNLGKYKIQYLGKNKFNSLEAVDLLLSGPVDPFHLYLDTQTLLPSGLSFQTITQQGPAAAEERLSDYRPVDGIKLFFKSEYFLNQKKENDQVFKEAKFNVVIAPDLFKID